MNVENHTEEGDLLIIGTAYFPEFEEKESTLFTASEMTREFADSVKSLPVYIEHDEKHQVGTIADAYIDENRQLKTMLHIHGNALAKEKLPAALSKDPESHEAFFQGLSLGNTIGLERNDSKIRVCENTPCEVSIVRKGDRPRTYIDSWEYLPASMTVQEYIRTNIEPNICRF